MKKRLPLTALGFALVGLAVLAPAAHGVPFSPTGSGFADAVNITGFDPFAGNTLAVGALPGTATVAGSNFRVVYQANLASLLTPAPFIPPGLNAAYALQLEANFDAFGSSPDGGATVFFTNPVGPGPFNDLFRLTHHPIGVAPNDRTGAGFTTEPVVAPDQVVLTATLNSLAGVAFVNGLDGLLDQAAGGPIGPPTLFTFGATSLLLDVTSVDPAFFPGQAPTQINVFFNTNDPFTNVGANSGTFFEGTVRNIGAVNAFSGPDIQFESDGNVDLIAPAQVIPEPATVSLLLLGLGGLGAVQVLRRRRARAAA
jgi:hypothetical protein